MISGVKTNIRFFSHSLPLCFAFALAACGGLDTFTIEQTAQTTVSGASILEQLAGDLGFGDLATFDVTENETLANQGVTKNQIDEIDHLLSTLTFDDASLQLIQQHNAVFHKTIMENCGNNFVKISIHKDYIFLLNHHFQKYYDHQVYC